MNGFDLLVEESFSEEQIKMNLLKATELDSNKVFFYRDVEELVNCGEDVTLQVGIYKKTGDVNFLLSVNCIEAIVGLTDLELAKKIAGKLASRCFYPSDEVEPSLFLALMPSGEIFHVYLYESKDGESYHLSEHDE